MEEWKVTIDISDLWKKYAPNNNFSLEEFLGELIPRLKSYTEDILIFGDYAQKEYIKIVDQLSRSDNDQNFNFNLVDLFEWVCDYDILIKK